MSFALFSLKVLIADEAEAVIQCVMKDRDTGKLLALGEHGKAALGSQDGKKPQISQL